MFPWRILVGVGLLLYGAYLIYRGEIDMTNRRRHNAPRMIYKRSEQPAVFWGFVLVILLGGVLMVLSPWW
jgi:hypothetical protein